VQETNPYMSPISEEPTGSADLDALAGGLPIASQGKRFLNYIIDHILVQVLSGAAGYLFGSLTVRANPQMTSDDVAAMQVGGFIIGLLIAIAYYLVMELACQRTIAKFITGTRVVTVDGGTPTFGQILGRTLSRMVPFEPFSFLFGQPPVGWHDSWSGTRVITTR